MTDYPKDKLFRIYAGDVGSDAYKYQYVEWLQQRLAAAEARADHVSFEHEVDTQQLEARLAAAEARIEWFEKSGGVAVHTIVFQRQMEIESLQAKLAAAEARVKELEQRGILNIDEVVNQFYEGS